MRGGKLLVAILLLTSGMAGCIGSDRAETDDEPAEPGSVEEPANTSRVDTALTEGEVGLSLATPASSFNLNPPTAGGPFQVELDRASTATGYLLELVWEAATPASEDLDLWVRDASEGSIPPEDPTEPLAAPPVATATGSSALTLVIQESDLEEGTTYNIIVRAPSEMGAGVAIQQPFELYVSTFLDQPVDEDFSAVDEDSSAP